ncbi:MAG: alpha-ketoglutarate-dependent dioxygenase AlkB [Deltaproteobacteria bacterium]|nr:alpha-ketoglutarate-dependent dioxygenase AlkB [Deltaproteobacteria bacterium]
MTGDGASVEELGGGATLLFLPRFLGEAEEAALFAELLSRVPWEAREIVLFGRPVLQPRLVAWCGERPYRYSGQTLPPREIPPGLAALCARVSARAGARFDHLLLNRYRDGRDSMGLHADDEPELGEDPVVATLSLGAPRPFRIVPRRGSGGRRLLLSGGSLLVMGGRFQREYRHGIPRVSAPVGERISVTFRQILGSGGGG